MPSQKFGSDWPSTASDGARDVVARAPEHRRDDAERDADAHREEHGRERELDGGGQPLEHHRQGGRPVLERLAEIAADHAPQEEAVLHDQRLAQPELAVQLVDGGLGRALGQEHPGGIARQDAEDHEDQHRHAEQGEGRLREPPQDVASSSARAMLRAPPGDSLGRRYTMETSLSRT